MNRRIALLTLSAAFAAAAALPAGGVSHDRLASPPAGDPAVPAPSLPASPTTPPGPEVPDLAPAPRPAAGPALPGRTYPLAPGEQFTWARYRPADGSGLAPLSGTAEMAFMEGQGEAAEAVPSGVIPALPASFAPNILVSQDLSSAPHNETAVAVNPRNSDNIVVGANDYRMGFGSSGFYASLDGGRTWRDGILPFPSVYFEPTRAAGRTDARTLLALDGGGDPALAFDSQGTVYYADINFHRVGCVSMILVYRSVNGGLTWNRPLFGKPLAGDVRNDGDGVVVMNTNDNDCSHFHDKEFIGAGPRPKDAALVPGTDEKHLSPDRVYVTWTDFRSAPGIAVQPYAAAARFIESPILISYTDDQGRHWSPPADVSGTNATVCTSSQTGRCDLNQGSVPMVDPRTGKVYVYRFNFNRSGGSQVLVVSSTDGGAAWSDPVRAAAVVDNNLPRAGEDLDPDPTNSKIRCPDQQSGRNVLSNTCFRVPLYGNIVIEPRSGTLFAVWVDNRNGTQKTIGQAPFTFVDRSTDTDVFLVSSTDGGATWSQPKRVNTDPLKNGKDQFFAWAAAGPDGTLYVSFLDRAGDPKNHDIGTTVCISRDQARSFSCTPVSTGLWNPDLAFRRGLFIGDYTGIAAGPNGAFAAWPDSRRARAAKPGDNPPSLFSEVVGSFSPGAGPTKVLGTKATRSRAAPKPALDLPATGVASHRSAWALLLIAAALAALALLRKEESTA